MPRIKKGSIIAEIREEARNNIQGDLICAIKLGMVPKNPYG